MTRGFDALFIRSLIAFAKLVCGSTLASEAFAAAAADIITLKVVSDVSRELVGVGAAVLSAIKAF